MKLPSGSNFGEGPFWKIGGAIGGAAYGAQTMDNMVKKNHHFKLNRSSERITRLTLGERNPPQFVLDCSRDNVSSFETKEDLVAWGETWRGTDYSNPDAFDVLSKERDSSNRIRSALGLKDRSSYLKTHPIDNKTESQSELVSSDTGFGSVPTIKEKENEVLKIKKKGKSGEDTGTRSVNIEGMEVQEATTNDINMEVQQVIGNGTNVSTGLYKFNPSLIYEVSAEQLETVQGEAVPDRQFTKVYEFTTSPPLPPIIYYGLSLTLLAGSTLLFRYLQRQYLKWSNSKAFKKDTSADSQGPASTTLQEPPPTTRENPVFGQQPHKSFGGMAGLEATPENFLELLTRYKRGLISKKATVYVLSKFYDLSVAEALEMLDESKG